MKKILLLCLFLGTALAQEFGKSAPDFTMYSPTLKQAVQLAKLQGKPVMLNFWGSWCGPCREEMPALNNVADKLKDKFVLLAIGSRESGTVSQKYLEDNNLKALVLLSDPETGLNLETSAAVNTKYNISAYPTSIFIDQNGIVQATKLGGMSEKMLLSYLKNIDVTP
jgi:thiol-disulfide isomerase/thioredoxin